MGQKQRVDRLEQTTGTTEDVVVVVWDDNPDQLVTVAGEEMTYAEYARRFPDREIVQLDWLD